MSAQKMPQNTALLAKLQGTGFAGMAPKKAANGTAPTGAVSAGGPENQAPTPVPEAPISAIPELADGPVAGIPALTDPEPLVPGTAPVTPFIPPLPTSFPPLGSIQTIPARKTQVAGGAGKGTLDLADFDAIMETMAGPQSRVGFSVEKQVHKWVTTQSAKKGLAAADFWREALSTEITPEWWGSHFNDEIKPGPYLRARHKAYGRLRTTTDIPTTLLEQIEDTRMALLEAFGDTGPLTRGGMLEMLIVKWALEMPARQAKETTELAEAAKAPIHQRGTAS